MFAALFVPCPTMKTFATVAVLFTCAAVAAENTGFEIKVTGVPADATEVVALVDTAAGPPAGYDDTPAVPVAQPAQPVAPADPAAQPQRRKRGAGIGRGNAAAAPAPVRVAMAANGASSVTLRAATVAGDKFQIRVLALRGGGASPVVLAGGRLATAKAEAEKFTPVEIAFTTPKLKIAPGNPTVVAPGAAYTLAGAITDASNCLGEKGRMRVWLSTGTPPHANYAGAQVSTIDVKNEGDDVTFSFTLTAPKERGTLYFQFGELPTAFARADGRQAPFLVLPDLSAGGAPLALRVE